MAETFPTAEAVEVERIAGQVAAAVAACPGVARLASGPDATYLPGRVVPGVAIRPGTVRVAVVARYGPSLVDVVERVRTVAAAAAPGKRVDVVVRDIDAPPVPTPADTAGSR